MPIAARGEQGSTAAGPGSRGPAPEGLIEVAQAEGLARRVPTMGENPHDM